LVALLEHGLFENMPSWLPPTVTAVVGFLVAFTWNRWWRRKDDHESSQSGAIKTHSDKIVVLEGRVNAIEIRDSDRQSTLGRLEEAQGRIEGKVGGLQEFWRGEFGGLRKELREDQARFRQELREDQKAFEDRMSTLLTGHQQRIHDRLNLIAADQAKLLTEFVDHMVDKKAGGKEP
jgi:hypothetical protein